MDSKRIQVLKWLKTMLTQEKAGQKIEVESKIGRFVGKNQHDQLRILKMNDDFMQLDKNAIPYEFQSKITQNQYELARSYLKDGRDLMRIDFNFSNKDQRASIIYDFSNQDQKYKGSGSLIEKKRQLSNHVDIIDGSFHYRISVNSEKELSQSLKDIYQQLEGRQQKINLIRIKQTYIVQDELFEKSLSCVHSIFKNNKTDFQNVIQMILSKKYDIKNCVSQVRDSFKEGKNVQPQYELEVEVRNDIPIGEETAEKLIDQTKEMCRIIGATIRRKGSQEFCEDPVKKVKPNE